MAVDLDVSINEGSSKTFTATFTDEDDAELTPTSINWTWLDEDGAILNSRDQVSLTVASSVNITLGSADTALRGVGDLKTRRLTIQAEYNSTYGSGLPLTEEVINIVIVPLKGVA